MPTKFFQATYGKNIRKIIHKNTNINHIIDLVLLKFLVKQHLRLLVFLKDEYKSEFLNLLNQTKPENNRKFSNIYK